MAGETTFAPANNKAIGWPRRRLVPLALLALFIVVLLLPWRASVSSYHALAALLGQDTIIRASGGATLGERRVRPGDQVALGAFLARLKAKDCPK